MIASSRSHRASRCAHKRSMVRVRVTVRVRVRARARARIRVRVRVAYRGEVAQVDAVHVQPVPPRGRVGQRGEARSGVDGEARGGEHRRSAAEQLDRHLVRARSR